MGNAARACNGGRDAVGGMRRAARRTVHYVIRFYQLTVSALIGRQCRYLPSCSAYMDEAVGRYGVGIGAVMGVARLCRCHPWGNHGFDPVPDQIPANASWARPWRYGDWHGPRHRTEISCEEMSREEIFSSAESGHSPSDPAAR